MRCSQQLRGPSRIILRTVPLGCVSYYIWMAQSWLLVEVNLLYHLSQHTIMVMGQRWFIDALKVYTANGSAVRGAGSPLEMPLAAGSSCNAPGKSDSCNAGSFFKAVPASVPLPSSGNPISDLSARRDLLCCSTGPLIKETRLTVVAKFALVDSNETLMTSTRDIATRIDVMDLTEERLIIVAAMNPNKLTLDNIRAQDRTAQRL